MPTDAEHAAMRRLLNEAMDAVHADGPRSAWYRTVLRRFSATLTARR